MAAHHLDAWNVGGPQPIPRPRRGPDARQGRHRGVATPLRFRDRERRTLIDVHEPRQGALAGSDQRRPPKARLRDLPHRRGARPARADGRLYGRHGSAAHHADAAGVVRGRRRAQLRGVREGPRRHASAPQKLRRPPRLRRPDRRANLATSQPDLHRRQARQRRPKGPEDLFRRRQRGPLRLPERQPASARLPGAARDPAPLAADRRGRPLVG